MDSKHDELQQIAESIRVRTWRNGKDGRYLVGAGWCTIIDVKIGRHPDPLRKVLRSLNSNVRQYVVKKEGRSQFARVPRPAMSRSSHHAQFRHVHTGLAPHAL